jgi:hypothetical protein
MGLYFLRRSLKIWKLFFKMQRKKSSMKVSNFLAVAYITLLSFNAWADAEPTKLVEAASGDAGYSLLHFRASQLSVFQSGGNTFSGVIDWAPEYRLNSQWGLVGTLGATVLLNSVGASGGNSSTFLAPEYAVAGNYNFNSSFSAEVGFGLQTWISTGTYVMVQANGVYKPSTRFFSVIDQIVVGYTPVFASAVAHEIRLGVQASF